MNKQYKVIFSETLKQYVVVSELVKGQGKGKGQKCRSVVASAVGTLALAGVMGLSTGFAYADTVVTAEGESASDATYTTGRNLQIKKTDSGGNVTYDLKLNNSVTLGDGTNTGTLTVKGTGSNQVVVEGGKVTASGTDPNQVVIDGTSGKITVKKKRVMMRVNIPRQRLKEQPLLRGIVLVALC